MKKAQVLLMISFCLVLSLFLFVNTAEASADNGPVWVKQYRTDVFGDPTGEYYLTNSQQFTGTYNSATVNNGSFTANIEICAKGGIPSAYVFFYEGGTEPVKNDTQSDIVYNIQIKKTDGNKMTARGVLRSGYDRIEVYADSTVDLAAALSSIGEISIYFEADDQHFNNYLFKVECGNFGDLYEQEIVIPHKDELYQRAVTLLQNKDYVNAAELFAALGDYKDSAARVAETKEAMKADAYAAAEALLENKDYDGAIAAFAALEDYRDSAARVTETVEAKKAYLYATAEALLENKDFNGALKIFRDLGDYRDSSEQYEKIKTSMITDAQVGSYVYFGWYEQDNMANGEELIEWLVLAREENKILVISRYALDSKAYNTNNVDVTWETCSLREWLNNDFLYTAFNDLEQMQIMTTTVNSDKNPKWDTDPGSITQDKVFLLSITEVNRYFGDDEARKCLPTFYSHANSGLPDGEQACYWWLRSPGFLPAYATYVGSDGIVHENGNNVYLKSIAVRPALWIDLAS